MLIKHDLFAGVKANPVALNNVQKELKEYIVSRLEILLGIREQSKPKKTQLQMVDFPFNNLEIEFLKKLSLKGTFGNSANGVSEKIQVEEVESDLEEVEEEIEEEEEEIEEPVLKPISQPVVKKTPKKTTAKPKVAKKAPKKKTPVKKKAPVKKQTPVKTQSRNVRRKGIGDNMTNAEAEAIAREELRKNGKGLSKHPYEMSAKELQELAKRNTKKTITPEGAKPMVGADQLQMMYQTNLANQTATAGGDILSKLINKTING
jgi:hypothetical protein